MSTAPNYPTIESIHSDFPELQGLITSYGSDLTETEILWNLYTDWDDANNEELELPFSYNLYRALSEYLNSLPETI